MNRMTTAIVTRFSIPETVLGEIVKEAVTVLSDGEVTFGEVVHLGGVLAGKVSQFGHLSAVDKKELIVTIAEMALEIVQTTVVPSLPEEKQVEFRSKLETAAEFVKDTLPAVIDVARDAAQGKFDLGDPVVQKGIWQVIKTIFGCIGVQVPELPTPVVGIVEALKEAPETLKALEPEALVGQVAQKVTDMIEETVATVVQDATAEAEKTVELVQVVLETSEKADTKE
jgi:hypothetical protein